MVAARRGFPFRAVFYAAPFDQGCQIKTATRSALPLPPGKQLPDPAQSVRAGARGSTEGHSASGSPPPGVLQSASPLTLPPQGLAPAPAGAGKIADNVPVPVGSGPPETPAALPLPSPVHPTAPNASPGPRPRRPVKLHRAIQRPDEPHPAATLTDGARIPRNGWADFAQTAIPIKFSLPQGKS